MFKAASGAVFRRVKAGAGGPRVILTQLLRDGNTVANYQLGVGLTGTTNATAWANQIGTAGSLLQASGAAQPTINADGSLTFNGSSTFLQTAAFTLNQPVTYYLVVQPSAYTTGNFQSMTSGVSGDANFYLYNLSAAVGMFAGTDLGPSAAPTVSLFHVFVYTFNGASSSWSVDGGSAHTGNTGANNPGGITLGAYMNGLSQFFNGSVKELIVRSVVDSAATKAQIQALLKALYGTP